MISFLVQLLISFILWQFKNTNKPIVYISSSWSPPVSVSNYWGALSATHITDIPLEWNKSYTMQSINQLIPGGGYTVRYRHVTSTANPFYQKTFLGECWRGFIEGLRS